MSGTRTRHLRPILAVLVATAACTVVPTWPTAATTTRPASANAASADTQLATAARRQLGSRPHQVVIVRNGRVVATTANTPGGVDRPQRIASISKAITAAAVFRLIDAGHLRLDTPVAPLLGVPAHASWASLTVEQLLSQRSGLPSDRESWFNGRWRSCEQAAGAALARRAQSKQYRYSNTNFCLLSLVIEAVTRMDHDQAVKILVFDPLAMRSPVPDPDYTRLLGAGQWRISARDLATFLCTIDLFSPRTGVCVDGFLSIESRVLMVAPTSYNYGRGIWRWPSGAWGHSGTLAGARNLVAKLPSGDIAVTLVQSNAYRSGLDLYVPTVRMAASVR